MNSEEEEQEDDEDNEMGDGEEFNLDEDSNEDLESEEDGPEEKPTRPVPATKTEKAPKPPKRSTMALQDGAYTSETFKSNIFKLQVDELLDQVKLKYGKKEAPAENAMRTLKTIIEQIPGREPQSVIEAEKSLKAAGIMVPFPGPHPPKDAQYKLQYERPASINVTGSYPLKTVTRSDDRYAIDLVVTIPKSLLQEKDYLNHRYFYKRAYYLACIAAGIKQDKSHKFKLSFDCLNGNQLQPILIIRPSETGDTDDFTASKCQIQVLVALPEHTFQQAKILPNSNCVRPKTIEEDQTTKILKPTPFYNATLQSDANITAYLKLLHATAAKVDAYRDACILGRVWLKQRNMSSSVSQGGFGNFEWATVMALLLQPNTVVGGQALSSGYSSYQLFKATLQFFARHDLAKKPYTFQAHNATFPKSEHAPVFFDGPRGQNVLFKMTHWSYSRLQLEAKATIDMLSDTLFDHFDATFILRAEAPRLKYDATLEIPASVLELHSDGKEKTIIDACRKLYNCLTRALTDRIKSLSFMLPEDNTWPVNAEKPKEVNDKSVLVQIITDPANAHRTVDHGPSAENKVEAAAFRKFWGEKSELRRFKDGSILESVVWSTKDSSNSIVEQIVMYILGKHISPSAANEAHFVGDQFAHLVPAGRIQGSSGVAPFLQIMNAFSAMEKAIRDLEDLPLRLHHLRAADPQLRYASVDPPLPGHTPASVVLQFEGSGRWPDDLCAIQRTKIAFLIRLAELLSQTDPGYSGRLGLENPAQPAQNQAFLDLSVPTGFTFRIRIYHDREVTLFDRQIKDKSLDNASREAAAASLAVYKQHFVQSPLHSQVLQNLCTRFLALSPSIRLTKRWFDSHMLSPHFAPELIELFVARCFVQPYPWSAPATATTGFLRTLAWLSRWDWRNVPFILDFSSNFTTNPAELEDATSKAMKSGDLERIQTRFEAWRRIDPAMNRVVLFAATNLDEEGTTWTDKTKPEKVVASRLTALAKAASQAVRANDDRLINGINKHDNTENEDGFTPNTLFSTNISDYDIVISVNPKHTLSHSKSRKSNAQFKNLQAQQSGHQEIASTPLPELFAQELLDIYGDSILWFWNPETSENIVGLWNPIVTGQRNWKVKAGWNSEPLRAKRLSQEKSKEVDIKVNKDAVINEIRRLGGDLIKEIVVKA